MNKRKSRGTLTAATVLAASVMFAFAGSSETYLEAPGYVRTSVPVEQEFEAAEATRTSAIILKGSPDDVFPLFSPVREAEWAEGFSPTILSSGQDPVRAGCVFTTEQPSRGKTIWLLSEYDQEERRVSYVRVTPTSNLAQITILVIPGKDRTSVAQVTYKFTSLSEKGNEYVSKFTEDYYREWIAGWETAINHYLTTGKRLTHHGSEK